MASGRVLVVHESGASRALVTELLAHAGLHVEAVDSTFACMAAAIDKPFDLVVIGLGGLDESELELIGALKRESEPPRILVTFPSPRRDFAVRALEAGADAYVLEPFYGEELVAVARGQLEPRQPTRPAEGLVHLAREVAHAVNNPLQVMTLLLQKDRVTKKELLEGLPGPVARVEQVVGFLRDFGAVPAPVCRAYDPWPIVEAVAAEFGVRCETEALVSARIDDRNFGEALRAILRAVRLRVGEGEELAARMLIERDAVVMRLAAPAEAFAEEGPAALLDAVFVVRPERDVLPGLARARVLLEAMEGSLTIHPRGGQLVFSARVPLA